MEQTVYDRHRRWSIVRITWNFTLPQSLHRNLEAVCIYTSTVFYLPFKYAMQPQRKNDVEEMVII